MPSTCCGVISGLGVRYAARPLPEHSMKCVRVTAGKRLRSATRELDRPVDEAVNEQRVLRRIDRRHAGVNAREMQIGRRDRAGQILERRERRAGDLADRRALRIDERRSRADGGRRRAGRLGRIGGRDGRAARRDRRAPPARRLLLRVGARQVGEQRSAGGGGRAGDERAPADRLARLMSIL